MKSSKYAMEDLPIVIDNEDLKVGSAGIGGGMWVNYERYHREVDLVPYFKNTKDNACHIPHWIYIIEGEFSCEFSDGTTERYVAEDVLYLPDWHKPVMGANCKVICFGRAKEVERQRKLIRLYKDHKDGVTESLKY